MYLACSRSSIPSPGVNVLKRKINLAAAHLTAREKKRFILEEINCKKVTSLGRALRDSFRGGTLRLGFKLALWECESAIRHLFVLLWSSLVLKNGVQDLNVVLNLQVFKFRLK
jgi:hypothetical protein